MKTLLALLLLIPTFSWGFESKLFDDWVVTVSVDDFTDKRSIFLYTDPNLNEKFGNDDDSFISMSIIKGEYKNVSHYTLFYGSFVCGNKKDDEEVDAIFRVDKNEPIELLLDSSTSKESGTTFTFRKKTKKLLDEIFLGDRLRVRLYDEICGEIHDYSFSLDGFNKAYEYALIELGK